METKYNRYSHAVGGNFWAFEWCTKYRYKMFRKELYKNVCTIFIHEVANRHRIELLALNVQPDHVHVIASLPRGMTDIRALQLLKGATARLLFLYEPKFRLRYPRGEFWADGKFGITVGFADLQTEIEYVKTQDVHHATVYA